MPKYKMICRVPKLTENGLEFKEGEEMTNNKGEVITVVLTEEEAAIMNKWGVAGVEVVPVGFKETKEVKEKKKTYAQMNKEERAEYAKQKAETKTT